MHSLIRSESRMDAQNNLQTFKRSWFWNLLTLFVKIEALFFWKPHNQETRHTRWNHISSSFHRVYISSINQASQTNCPISGLMNSFISILNILRILDKPNGIISHLSITLDFKGCFSFILFFYSNLTITTT